MTNVQGKTEAWLKLTLSHLPPIQLRNISPQIDALTTIFFFFFWMVCEVIDS